MPMTVNTNSFSLNAQRQLMKSEAGLQTSMQRLSSGLRINSAKDDAAGLQISNRLSSQVSGLGVAIRNANDGISLAQTAEGAMQETTNILQRMRDLALQASNGSNSGADRTAMQTEVTALLEEINRIADTTNFGGQNLLDGTYGTQEFQIGANANQTMDITINSVKTADLGGTGSTGKTLDLDSFDATAIGDAAETVTFNITNDTGSYTGAYSIDVAVAAGAGSEEFVSDVNAALNKYGVYAEFNSATGAVTFATAESVSDVYTETTGGIVTTTSTQANLGTSGSGTLGGLTGVDISTSGGAQTAIGVIDQAIAAVDSQRASLGAVQNRLTSTISNLSNIRENVSASRGRIMDADFASETANLSKFQVMQQAGTAVLAQANQIPQNVLSLLR